MKLIVEFDIKDNLTEDELDCIYDEIDLVSYTLYKEYDFTIEMTKYTLNENNLIDSIKEKIVKNNTWLEYINCYAEACELKKLRKISDDEFKQFANEFNLTIDQFDEIMQFKENYPSWFV